MLKTSQNKSKKVLQLKLMEILYYRLITKKFFPQNITLFNIITFAALGQLFSPLLNVALVRINVIIGTYINPRIVNNTRCVKRARPFIKPCDKIR